MTLKGFKKIVTITLAFKIYMYSPKFSKNLACTLKGFRIDKIIT